MASPRPARLSWPDVLAPLALLVVGLVGTGPAARNTQMPAPPLAYVLVVVAALGLLAWRVRPLWTLAVTGAAVTVYVLLGYTYGPIMFSYAVAAFGAALWLPLRRALAATATVLVATLAATAASTLAGGGGWGETAITALFAIPTWFVIPAAIGVAIRTRRDATAAVRSAQARRAVSEERLRLAQEVHDVAGHGFAVIAMQAGVALRVLDRDPAAARAALDGIRAASRDALAGLRAEVEALRAGAEADGRADDAAPRRPNSGLADLPALLARMQAAGLPVTLEPLASTVDVSPEVEFVAFRIVQEALTNVLRHAGPRASARVALQLRDDHLQVTVRDDGVGGEAGDGGAGHGIDGMRRRAESVGGTLVAGPVATGGFAVTAALPLSRKDGRE